MLRESQNRVQRRAKLIRHMLDEVRLQIVGGFQCIVAIAQGVFDAGAVGDVGKRCKRCPIRQRRKRDRQHGVIVAFNLAPVTPPFRSRHNAGDQLFPNGLLPEFVCTRRRNLAHMRFAREIALAQIPDAGERCIRKLQLAVRPEHGNGFLQGVERCRLHFDKRVVGAFQRDLLGNVFI